MKKKKKKRNKPKSHVFEVMLESSDHAIVKLSNRDTKILLFVIFTPFFVIYLSALILAIYGSFLFVPPIAFLIIIPIASIIMGPMLLIIFFFLVRAILQTRYLKIDNVKQCILFETDYRVYKTQKKILYSAIVKIFIIKEVMPFGRRRRDRLYTLIFYLSNGRPREIAAIGYRYLSELKELKKFLINNMKL